MVEFIDGDQAIVKRFYAVGIDREAKGCVCANKHLVATFKKRAESSYLATVVVTGQSAQNPNCDSGSSLKLAPIDFSGTTMIACLIP